MYYILQNGSILVNTVGATPLSALLKPEITLIPVLEFVYDEEYTNIALNPSEKALATWSLSANVYLIKQTAPISSLVEASLKKNDKPISLDPATYGESLIGPITTFRNLISSENVGNEISLFDTKGYEASVARKKEEIREKFDSRAREWVQRWYEIHEEILEEEKVSEQRKIAAVTADEDAVLEELENNELIAEAKIQESVTTLNELYVQREKLHDKIVKLYSDVYYSETTPLITWNAVVEGMKAKSRLSNAGIIHSLITKYGDEAFFYIHESILDGITQFLYLVEKVNSESSVETTVKHTEIETPTPSMEEFS